jgi:hypothetical protein
MASLVSEIADAVVEELNAGGFSQAFTAAKAFRFLADLGDLATLSVVVVPASQEIARLDRQQNRHEVAVDVVVRKKVTETEGEEVEDLLSLVDEIGDFFRLRRLAAYPEAVWMRTENAPLYVPQHLDQLRQFTGVLTLVFWVARSVGDET